jgi:hypothetical protein
MNNQSQNKIPKSQTKQTQTNGKTDKTLSCCCDLPHDTFPGVAHYFNSTRNEPSPFTRRRTCVQNARTTFSDEEKQDNDYQNEEDKEDGHDDDDDVIIEDASANK